MLWLLQNTECVSKFSYLKEISQNISFAIPAPRPYTTKAVQLACALVSLFLNDRVQMN